MLRKIAYPLNQADEIDSTNDNRKTNDAVTSQQTFQLLDRWSQLASKSSNNVGAAQQCQKIIEFLEENCKGTTLEPNRHYYDLLLQALCATGQVQVAHEVLLKNSKSNLEREGNARPVNVSAKSFHIVMNGWINKGSKQRRTNSRRHPQKVLIQVEELYQILESLHQTTGKRDGELRPNERTLTALLGAWARSRRNDAHNRIVQLLRQASEDGTKVDLVLFHTLLQSLTKEAAPTKNRMASRQTAELCEHLLQMATSQFDLIPTTQSYSLVIHAWAQCEVTEQMGRAAERAEKLLRLMMQSYSNDGANVKPNTLTFTTCMAAWSRCNQPEKAQALLEELLELYEQTKDPDLKPDTVCGNAVVLAWSRSDTPIAVRKTKKALEDIKLFATADLVSYNALLHAYSRSAMYREALALVEELEENGVKDSRLLPDVVSYNCILHALVRNKMEEVRAEKGFGIGMEAKTIVEKMKVLATKTNRASVAPTTATYTLLLQAYSRQGNRIVAPHDATSSKVPSLEDIRQVLEHTLGLPQSEPSPQLGKKNKQTKSVDAMFFVALLQSCSSEYQVHSNHNEASRLTFEVMIRMLKASSGGSYDELKPIAALVPALSILPKFPAFRIYDDWLFVVMLETCERVLRNDGQDWGEPEMAGNRTGTGIKTKAIGHSTHQQVISGTTTDTMATSMTSNNCDSVTIDEWMALIVAIISRVLKEGYLSRRVVARLQTLSMTLSKHGSGPGKQARTIEECFFPDASAANDNSMLGLRREWPREWSRRIPSRHRP
ncbi:MAG: hypothetical protein SGBAC_008728 [Bacillariaceae sp.]